jgi:hypothetical protein
MTNDSQLPPQFEAKPALERLGRLVGEWQTVIHMPSISPDPFYGRTIFEWSELGPFLIERARVEGEGWPVGTSIIGGDDTTNTYVMLESDSRGVFRIYQMSLSDTELKRWRDAPGFAQRFTGTFSADGQTITGAAETSSDGVQWEKDFDLTYTKL